ncbi:TRAP transporter large permease [Falsiroseomonas sp.]|uniref:TRAP transporter large permease n=1 Tax=Falsiroseomonas sp. TaxID=2870721 RepID=UPI0027244D5C|nr:TRAP transporter large permease [Falsiroseomonas sp.]MDO9500549.1 TRAP transporter large permease [Falsiroseomonas sp.]MDP3415483.1 TRAP transporter large permease [Falsiroseomonas sp.]
MSLFLTIFALFMVIAMFGVPLVWAMLIATFAYMQMSDNFYVMEGMLLSFIGGVEPFHLLAVPMFIVAGEIMVAGGVGRRMIDFASKALGFLRGGLGVVTVSSSMLFSGVSGSAVADSAAIGSVMIPGMKQRGYTKEFAAALVAVAGTIGIIIPPSIPMVIFAFMGNVSVKELFLAGFIPGLLFGGALILWCMHVGKTRGWDPGGQRTSADELIASFKGCIPALLFPVVILGGIFGGVFTPTEAAAVAVFYALLVGRFIYNELALADVPRILRDSFITSATVMLVIGATTAFAWVMTMEGVPMDLVAILRAWDLGKWEFLLVVNIALLLLGIFLEPVPALILTAPLLLPVARDLGIDPVHLGLIMVCNLAIGLFTPPVGGTLFVSAKIADARMWGITKELGPMFALCCLVLVIVTYFPAFVMAPVAWFR